MQQILNHVKRLGEEVALERLEGPVGNETHDSDGQNEKPKNGSVHGHPEVKVALIDASNKRTRAHATELGKVTARNGADVPQCLRKTKD
jgi:hypothetical protein